MSKGNGPVNPQAAEIDNEDFRNTEGQEPGDNEYLRKAATCYRDSTDYYESSLYDNWRQNLAHFQSEHESGSKYYTDAYKSRSRLFRPKPRSTVRTLDAVAASALFTNNDLLSVDGLDPNNQVQADSAKLHKAILQYRLENTIPWMVTAIGARQDTDIYGICISRQYWDYKEKVTSVDYELAIDEETGEPILDEETGDPMGYEHKNTEVIANEPVIDMIPPDNFRFDPNADWRQVVKSSPYLIHLTQMYAVDVLNMMKQDASEAMGPEWEQQTLAKICTAGRIEDDSGESVRLARQGDEQEDPIDISTLNEYTPVWVRFVILRDETGEDMAFYTLGDNVLVTKPVPLTEYSPIGREMYTIGFSTIETHKTNPAGIVQMSRPLTSMINEVTNQRMDNVRLVLNKRYLLRRGARIDLNALMRNAPGGGVITDDPAKDVETMDTPDVTVSSYQEQDRLSVETDELTGTFSQSSVQSNRNLNETVGGMDLMSSAANSVQELGLRVWIETWVEPVLKSLIKLESVFEDDDVLLQLAASKAEVVGQIDDEMMMQDLVVKVNVGMGNTNPDQKMKRFLAPLAQIKDLPEFAAEIDWEQVGAEIFSLAGQGDGERFMLNDEKKAEREANRPEEQPDPRIVVAQINAEFQQVRNELLQLQIEQDSVLRELKIITDKETKMAEISAKHGTSVEKMRADMMMSRAELDRKTELEAQRDQTQRDIAAQQGKIENIKVRLQQINMSRGFDTF